MLTVRGLTKTFATSDGRFQALKGIDFDIPAGGFRDVITDFNATQDQFVFDGISTPALANWQLLEDFGGPGIDIVRVDLDGSHSGDFGWEMAIELHGLTGTLSNDNFLFA